MKRSRNLDRKIAGILLMITFVVFPVYCTTVSCYYICRLLDVSMGHEIAARARSAHRLSHVSSQAMLVEECAFLLC